MCIKNHSKARFTSPNDFPNIKPTQLAHNTLSQLIPAIKVNRSRFKEHKMRKPSFDKLHSRDNLIGVPRFIHEKPVIGSRRRRSESFFFWENRMFSFPGLENTSIVMMREHSDRALGGVCLTHSLDQRLPGSPTDDVIRYAFPGAWIEFIERRGNPSQGRIGKTRIPKRIAG
jgi:hypothetical protein